MTGRRPKPPNRALAVTERSPCSPAPAPNRSAGNCSRSPRSCPASWPGPRSTSGHSGTAQQHFIQALRLARAGGDAEMGTYILTTMALHTLPEGAPDQALDMALLDKIQPGTHDPMWISYVTYGRLAADATEIFRDLHNPKAALRWSEQASDMSDDVHTRAVGLRLAVVATAALAPWAADARVRDVTERLDQRLTHAVAKEVI